MVIIMARYAFPTGTLKSVVTRVPEFLRLTRLEKGCLHFNLSIDMTDEDVMCITERWETEADLVAHFGTAHVQAYVAALPTPVSAKTEQYAAESVAFVRDRNPSIAKVR